jgi:hypothetical protein
MLSKRILTSWARGFKHLNCQFSTGGHRPPSWERLYKLIEEEEKRTGSTDPCLKMQNGHVFFLPNTRPVNRSGHLHAVKNFRIKTYYLYNCCIDLKLHWPSVLAHTQMVRATPIWYEMPHVLKKY